MDSTQLTTSLSEAGDIIQLRPQVVGRFYQDLNRLGQRSADAPRPAYYQPERWIASATVAVNPAPIPSGGASQCAHLSDSGGRPLLLKNLLSHPETGPRLLGQDRYTSHAGSFRVLIKLLDAAYPIPFHVHADDAFVTRHPKIYPHESFGKDEAYHYLEAPKGDCPFTHIGLHGGVTPAELLAAMRRGTDYLLELSPAALQRYGEGFFVKAGLLHRPGSALTLEVQQPSDVYALFQLDLGREAIPAAALHPGFDTHEEALEAVVNWKENTAAGLLEASRLTPMSADLLVRNGGKADWIFPPEASSKFSGLRLTIDTEVVFKVAQPCALFVWSGTGAMDELAIEGGAGRPMAADEFFIGEAAAKRGITLRNTGEEPLVVFAVFAAVVG